MLDAFGSSLASDTDVNNDGYNDVVVGAGYGAPSEEGRVYVFFGSKAMQSKNAVNANVIYTGEIAGDRFGGYSRDRVSAGDINADGYDDVIIGAPYNDNYDNAAGRTYVFYGSNSMTNKSALNADIVYTGEGNDDRSGMSIDLAGDINNDGYDDFLISGAKNDRAGTDTGSAYIFFGGSNLISKSVGEADIILTGENNSDHFGTLVTNGGDFNNDGWKEVIIGAKNYNSGQGKAYIYNLNYTNPSINLSGNGIYAANEESVDLGGLTSLGKQEANIKGVQWKLGSNGYAGGWSSCVSSDGDFNSSYFENYNCNVHGSVLSEGRYSLYVRQYDNNSVYIPSTLFASNVFKVDRTSPSGFSLLEPKNNETISLNTNHQSPVTFRWHANAKDNLGTPIDSNSGIDRYAFKIFKDNTTSKVKMQDTLEVDSSDEEEIYYIDNIPMEPYPEDGSQKSPTYTVEEDDYTIKYQGFNDDTQADAGDLQSLDNNYITVTLKKNVFDESGKYKWKVHAVDRAGNIREEHRILNIEPGENSEMGNTKSFVPGSGEVFDPGTEDKVKTDSNENLLQKTVKDVQKKFASSANEIATASKALGEKTKKVVGNPLAYIILGILFISTPFLIKFLKP